MQVEWWWLVIASSVGMSMGVCLHAALANSAAVEAEQRLYAVYAAVARSGSAKALDAADAALRRYDQ